MSPVSSREKEAIEDRSPKARKLPPKMHGPQRRLHPGGEEVALAVEVL